MSKEYIRPVNVLGQIPFVNQIIYHDDFENLLNWTKGSPGGDDIFELDPTYSQQGSQSLHLKTRTTGSQDTDYIYARLYNYLRPTKLINAITNFYIPSLPYIGYTSIEISFVDGTLIHKAGIKYIASPPKLQYLNSSGTYTDIPDFAVYLDARAPHQLTISINFNLHKYRFLELDHLHYDLSPYSVYNDKSTQAIYLETVLRLVNKTATPVEMYLDSFTIHEL